MVILPNQINKMINKIAYQTWYKFNQHITEKVGNMSAATENRIFYKTMPLQMAVQEISQHAVVCIPVGENYGD